MLGRIILLLFCAGLSFEGWSQTTTPFSRMDQKAIEKTFAAIEEYGAYTESLTPTTCNVLPIGLKRTINTVQVTIAIDKAEFFPTHTELSVYAKAVIPQKSDKEQHTILFFGARGIKLSYDGAILGDARLALLEDIEIPFNDEKMALVLKGSYDPKTENSNSRTYMTIDCKGFKEFGLDAEVVFSTSMIRSTDSTRSEKDRAVRGKFTTVVSSWDDIIAEISLPSFEVIGLNGYAFNLSNVVFDFSDIRNSPTTYYPSGYEQKYMVPGIPELWRGVYAEAVEITFPNMFDSKNGNPTTISARGLLIDQNGISGLFSAQNVLPFNLGSASGWSFSVSGFSLELEANKIIGAGFDGEIGLPFDTKESQGQTKLGYKAIIRENNEYLMQVMPTDTLNFALFGATATLLPNSYLKLHVVDNQFRPEAMLHGSLAFAPDQSNSKEGTPATIPKLDFQSLLIQTKAPYISVKYMGYEGKVSFGDFPVSLHSIALRCADDKVELSAGVDVSLMQGTISGGTKLAFLASATGSANNKRWQFDGVRLDGIKVEANIAETLRLKGEVLWHRADPVFGDGFYGSIQVDVTKFGNLSIGMRGGFGAKDDFRYWFVEGGVIPPIPIPIGTAFTLDGFSGAVAYKMVGTGVRKTQPGDAFSTVEYIPDRNTALSLKAAVKIGAAKIAGGEACFDISFSNSGGLNFIGFYGYVEFAPSEKIKIPGLDALSETFGKLLAEEKGAGAKMNLLKQTAPQDAALSLLKTLAKGLSMSVSGSLGLQYDFRNHAFHAETEVWVNAGVLQGVGPGGSAGRGVIHADPSEWYVHLGTPDNPIGVMLGVAGILDVRCGAYMMTGSSMPAMPTPPREVADILGRDLSELTLSRNLDELAKGGGFAFGSNFSIHTGDITFLMLYANFSAGLGFDIMMKDFGPLECRGRSGPIGMNGWYARGQAYTYLQGELGVKIDLWFLKTKIPVIKGGAAAMLQAMLPNPSSFRGYLGVNINILGLIEGNMRFKLSIGDECDPVMPGSSPLKMAMINDLSPREGTTEASVFTMPQATFNTQIGQSFQAEDDKGTGTYRIQLRSFEVTDPNGSTVAGSWKLNTTKDAAIFQSQEILTPNATLKARVAVSFDRWQDGRWQTVSTSGQEAIEEKIVAFSTGTAPDYIPLENIEYTYPVVDQRYYLSKESRDGFAQLRIGQKYLFAQGFDYYLLFESNGQKPLGADFAYDTVQRRLNFSLPELKTDQKYILRIAYQPDRETSTSKPASNETKEVLNSDDGQMSMTDRKASAGINKEVEKEILKYSFRSSRYTTFRQKMASYRTDRSPVVQNTGITLRFLHQLEAPEAFDRAEVVGSEKSGSVPLMQSYATLREPFYTQTVYPMIYAGYPVAGLRLRYRSEEPIGVPPVRSIVIYGPYLDKIDENQTASRFFFPFAYDATIAFELDIRDLQSVVVNNRNLVDNQTFLRFLNARLPYPKRGIYHTVFKYVLPDGRETSTFDFQYNNFSVLNE